MYKINLDFLSSRMNEDEILKVIKNVYEKFEIILEEMNNCSFFKLKSKSNFHL